MKGISGIKNINLKYKLFSEMFRLPLFPTAGASSDLPPASRRQQSYRRRLVAGVSAPALDHPGHSISSPLLP